MSWTFATLCRHLLQMRSGQARVPYLIVRIMLIYRFESSSHYSFLSQRPIDDNVKPPLCADPANVRGRDLYHLKLYELEECNNPILEPRISGTESQVSLQRKALAAMLCYSPPCAFIRADLFLSSNFPPHIQFIVNRTHIFNI